MLRLLCVLLFGLLMEAVGVVLLSKGLKEIGEMASVSVPEILRMVGRGITNRNLLSGVALEAGFFGCLLFLLSRGDVSFVWPLTALSFVFSTVAAIVFLGERVSGLRWAGIVFILVGAAIITYTEKHKERAQAAAKQSAAVATRD